MRRVCKKEGLLLFLNCGESESKYLKWYYRFQLPVYLMEFGYFPNRPWGRIFTDMGFKELQSQNFFNGTLQYRILSNENKK